ncbi:MAG: PTS mannitol transporter subunit IICB [bacterium]|nr:PTS mannitol transporter subunit IICB [bacterium]MCY3579871.1 PTS mannitol transporter subunit IICB [bacterium]MCY3651642.1 PTS mannitol transporter subunit IICB [bacterium]MDE0643966.1 PTS mannitol transporter subunit IICB [bacterium]
MLTRLQQFGGFMAGMVIPNIGAFIAWGLITAFFIPTGWTPNEDLSELVGPIIVYLLPILIGFTGGKMIYDHRGGVMGAIATAGIVVGSDFELASGAAGDPPQFLGAMVVGPLAAWIIMKVDDALEDSVPVGFEMLYNTFSAGILGFILAILGKVIMGPIMAAIANTFGNAVDWFTDLGLLPLADIPIEVGKVLFLNNAINHGVLGPLGAADAAETGRSIYFLLETNPGPGLGLLAAYWWAGKGLAKLSAPGSIVIHFFGGIHEIYFPYILMHPIMILSVWAGGILADIIFVAFDAGLSATPSPGSIFAYLAVTPSGQHFPVLFGVFAAAVAAFIVGSLLLRIYPVKEREGTEEMIGTMPAVPTGR